jgi:hypothetical protein
VRPEHDPFELPEPLTLRLYRGEQVLFASEGRWLHPLFELEAVFAGGVDPAGTRILDRVTGRAAAFLVARLGVPSLRTRVLSRRAVPVLERYGIAYEALQIVDQIACATEELLGEIDDLESAYALLAERRRRAGARRES